MSYTGELPLERQHLSYILKRRSLAMIIHVREQAIKAVWLGPKQCERCGIRNLVLFADLNEGDFYKIHHPIVELDFDSGQSLYTQGDVPDYVYTLRSGLVKLVTYLKDGKQRVVRLLKRGDLAGIEALENQPYEHNAVVLETVSVCRIPVNVVNGLDAETPRVRRQLTARWHRSVQEADFWLTSLSIGSARSRVTRLFLYLDSYADGEHFYLPSREDMGSMLAITTETASRIVSELKQKGILQVVSVHRAQADSDALQRIADE